MLREYGDWHLTNTERRWQQTPAVISIQRKCQLSIGAHALKNRGKRECDKIWKDMVRERTIHVGEEWCDKKSWLAWCVGQTILSEAELGAFCNAWSVRIILHSHYQEDGSLGPCQHTQLLSPTHTPNLHKGNNWSDPHSHLMKITPLWFKKASCWIMRLVHN